MTRDAVLRAVGAGRTTAEVAQTLQCSVSHGNARAERTASEGVSRVGDRGAEAAAMAPKLDRDAVLHSRDRHGLLSTYTYWKCRCEACRAANAAYHQQLRMSRNPKDAKEHGTLSTYVNYRCRCEVCSAANRGRFHAGS